LIGPACAKADERSRRNGKKEEEQQHKLSVPSPFLTTTTTPIAEQLMTGA
jgi:hypothetical protein